MERLVVFLDNEIYGGSERLMYTVLTSKLIRENYIVNALYGYNKPMHDGLVRDYGDRYDSIFTSAPIYCNELYIRIHMSQLPKLLKMTFKFPFWLFKKTGLKIIYNFIVLLFYVIRMKPDLIHINNGGYPASVNCRIMVFIASLLHRKCVMHVNNQAVKQRFLEPYMDRFINRKVSYFIVASKLAKHNLLVNRHFDVNKISIVPNAVKEESIKISREELLSIYGISNDKIVVLELAFLQYSKGQRFLIESIEKIKEETPLLGSKLHLILSGSGEDEQVLKEMVKVKNMGDMITFTGYCNNPIDFINAADIFALPSVANEDMPLVILSAMKLGKPIVATNFAGIQEEIESGVSGILIEPNEQTIVDNLVHALIEMSHCNNIWGKNAQVRYEELFSPKIYERKLLEIYSKS